MAAEASESEESSTVEMREPHPRTRLFVVLLAMFAAWITLLAVLNLAA